MAAPPGAGPRPAAVRWAAVPFDVVRHRRTHGVEEASEPTTTGTRLKGGCRRPYPAGRGVPSRPCGLRGGPGGDGQRPRHRPGNPFSSGVVSVGDHEHLVVKLQGWGRELTCHEAEAR